MDKSKEKGSLELYYQFGAVCVKSDNVTLDQIEMYINFLKSNELEWLRVSFQYDDEESINQSNDNAEYANIINNNNQSLDIGNY